MHWDFNKQKYVSSNKKKTVKILKAPKKPEKTKNKKEFVKIKTAKELIDYIEKYKLDPELIKLGYRVGQMTLYGDYANIAYYVKVPNPNYAKQMKKYASDLKKYEEQVKKDLEIADLEFDKKIKKCNEELEKISQQRMELDAKTSKTNKNSEKNT